MIKKTNLLSLFLIFGFIDGTLRAQAPAQDAKLYGDLDFEAGKSSLPDYPRGFGPNQHWQSWLNLYYSKSKFLAHLGSVLNGGAILDNPDQFKFQADLSYMIKPGYSIFLMHDDRYALNLETVHDYSARRPNSSVNSWWLGFRYGVLNKKNQSLNLWSQMTLRGDEPLYFRYFTKPYANKALGVEDSYKKFGLVFTGTGKVYFSNSIAQNRTELEGKFEKAVTSYLFLGLRGVHYFNVNTPSELKTYKGKQLHSGGAIFGTMKIEFGSR